MTCGYIDREMFSTEQVEGASGSVSVIEKTQCPKSGARQIKVLGRRKVRRYDGELRF